MSTPEKKINYPVVELQAIARAIGDATTTRDIELVVSRQGLVLNHELGAKWRMLADVFVKCSEKSFWWMLDDFLYFLDRDGEKVVEEVLERHGVHMENNGDGYFIIAQKDMAITEDHWRTDDLKQKALAHIRNDEAFAEKIKDTREHHQAYIDVVELFCKDYKNPSTELNEAYVYLKTLLKKELEGLGIDLYIPFKDIYSAESEYTLEPLALSLDGRPEGISWHYFRPKLYGTHSQIVQLLNDAKPTTQTEAKVQEINTFVSKLRAEQTEASKVKSDSRREVSRKIEVTHTIPEIIFKNVERTKGGQYITKNGDDFSYKGRHLDLGKASDYYKVFCALYAKLPNGGEITYQDLISEVKSRLPEKEKVLYDEMRKFIQRNLTDKSNGFVRYADIPETEDNGKPLIYVNRGSGIGFNNQAG